MVQNIPGLNVCWFGIGRCHFTFHIDAVMLKQTVEDF